MTFHDSSATKETDVLLVEDNPADADLILATLSKDPQSRFQVARAASLAETERILEQRSFDVGLLDLMLPDSEGLETFDRVAVMAPDLPIVVLTGLHDESLGDEAIARGAQDYLVKGESRHLLLRAIRYAVERLHLQAQLEKARERKRQERLMAFAAARKGDRQGLPADLVPRYMVLVGRYVKSTRTREARPSSDMREFAAEIATVGATAKEVVRLHLDMLAQAHKKSWATEAERQRFSSDARLALVEIMGHLVDIYRDIHPGVEDDG